MTDYAEFDLSGIETYPLASRPSKVRVADFATPFVAGSGVPGWLVSLPRILAGADFVATIEAIRAAKQRAAPIVWGIGGHVVKTGLGPVLTDLMARGFVSALATNGAGVIHDFEIAIGGQTSEDVDGALGPGQFGMAKETGEELNAAVIAGAGRGEGFGQAVGRWLLDRRPPYASSSVMAEATRLGIPVTVHVAMGTDIIHMHPMASGAAIGEASLRDFRRFTSIVAGLAGGVYLNCGSAVVLPEVFLKAVALVRNRGITLDGLTTVSLDFIRHYRPQVNVVQRPTQGIGRGIALVGHHELLIPLIAAALVEGQEGGGETQT
jgi:hypothetical protein